MLKFCGGNDDALSFCGKGIASAGGFMDRNPVFKLLSLLLMIIVGACSILSSTWLVRSSWVGMP
jgi:hypothetical protein